MLGSFSFIFFIMPTQTDLDIYNPKYTTAIYLGQELSKLANLLDLFLIREVKRDDEYLQIDYNLQSASGKRYISVVYHKAALRLELKRVASRPTSLQPVIKHVKKMQNSFNERYSEIAGEFILNFARKNEAKFLIETNIDNDYNELYLNMDRKNDKESIEFIFMDPDHQE